MRPQMTMKQFYDHCHRCPFLHMPAECNRAQKIQGYCPEKR